MCQKVDVVWFEKLKSHPGAKFGYFVGDVEAKSGYGRSC